MKTRRFDYNFRPLQLNIGFSVDGSVPSRQSYDADTCEYTPDYTLTPLIIQPNVGCMDKDEFLQSGNVNAGLANVKWYEIEDGVSRLIDSGNTDYEITVSGGNAGRIKVKRNVQPKSPVTLEFHAEYVDPRTGQIHVIQRAYTVTCNNSTAHAPQLVLDAADQTIYNPLYDPDKQTVHASLRLGTKECPAENRVFVWEKFRSDSDTWTEVGMDPAMDYDVEVAPDGASCIVDRSLMGSELYLRCRALYVPGGVPAEMRPNLLLNSAETVVNSEYLMAMYQPAGNLGFEPGDDFTCTIWGQLGENKRGFAFYDYNGNTTPGTLRLVSPGVYRLIAKWSLTNYAGEITGDFSTIKIYAAHSTETSESRIDRIKLEAGRNENPVWTPAANEGIGQYLQLAESAPMKQIAFVRRIPKYEYDITGVPTNIPAGSLAIAPEASIRDTNGALPDPERELLPLWYIAPNKPSGTLDYTQVAHGMAPTISTAAMNNTHGAVVGLDVLDVGPACAMEDSDGTLFEDSDGNIIIIK